MHLLPLSLGRVAELAEKNDAGGRFALPNVHFRANNDKTFTVEATDTRRLIRVTGSHREDPADYPTAFIPGFDSSPNGGTDALIPAATWKAVFAKAGKMTPARITKPVLRGVAVRVGKDVTTFGATDAASTMCESVRNGEGRFPPVADVLAGLKPGTGKARVSVDPTCPAHKGHGRTVRRASLTAERRWCGAWFDCRRCASGVLYPSRELLQTPRVRRAKT